MPSPAFRALLLAAALLTLPARAPAAPGAPPPDTAGSAASPAPEGDGVTVSAARLERQTEGRLIVGEGAVEIRQRDLRLAADRVVLHEDTKDVVADGNVVFDSGQGRLQGEHLELNLDTRIGFIEHGQGFVQSYYFTGERIEKLGPDRYFIRNGRFTTCEGQLPDWSFHSTSTTVTVDEYLTAWNAALFVKRLPVFYLPYALFPIKRDRATGLLIPEIKYGNIDGFAVRNQFYWAPRDDFDATLGLDYLGRTGWGALGELRYLLGARTHGEINAYLVKNVATDAERWSVTSRHSHDLPLGFHGEAEVFFQSDRQFISSYGDTLEQRSNERTSSSFYLGRSWSAYGFAFSGKQDVSLVTAQRTTITRFPEITIDRTSSRLLDSDFFLKAGASAVRLARTDAQSDIATTRLHISPELTWPLSLRGVVSILPAAGYDLTHYTRDTEGEERTRSLGYYRLGLEGPRISRIFELSGSGHEKLKHLIEPRVSYLYTPRVDQSGIPQFDSLDTIAPANRLEYSVTNTLFGKTRLGVVRPPPETPPAPGGGAPPGPDMGDGAKTVPGEGGGNDTAGAVQPPVYAVQELFWFKLSQTYTFDQADTAAPGHRFSPVEWEARTRPLAGLDLWWKGNLDVYGKGVGYQNFSVSWKAWDVASLKGEWRTARDTNQDFLDLGASFDFGRIAIEGRSRYNLAEKSFVENRITLKRSSACWEISLGWVKWTTDYQYTLQVSLKGIGTIVKI